MIMIADDTGKVQKQKQKRQGTASNMSHFNNCFAPALLHLQKEGLRRTDLIAKWRRTV